MSADQAFPAQQLDELLEASPGRIGAYLKDLDSGATYERRSDDRFPTASIFKVSVMVELFRQAEAGVVSLNERRRLENDRFSTHGTGHLKLLQDEPELTLRDYCRLMMGISDNMATDLLIEVLGTDAICATMEALGLPNTRASMPIGRWHYLLGNMGNVPFNRTNDAILLRNLRAGKQDWKGLAASDSLGNNVTTPREIGALVEEIHLGRTISPRASAEMLSMLNCSVRSGLIPRDIRKDVAIANKYGSGGGVKGDVGIVYLPTGPLLVSAILFCPTGGGEAIPEVARLAVAARAPECLAH